MKRSGPPARKPGTQRAWEQRSRDAALERARANHPSSSGPTRSAPPRARSKARAAEIRTTRIPTIEAMVAEGRTCEVCPLLASIGITTHCAGRIEGLHERRKSGAGGSRVTGANLVPACNWGNTAVEDHAGQVRDLLGDLLVVREGDPEWELLGRRRDRESTPDT